MRSLPLSTFLNALLPVVLALSATLSAQTGEGERPAPTPGNPTPPLPGPGPQGAAREAMWFAPTAEDWQKPVLITFQRTWEDALAVSRETNKPILVCVNMDGEIASEHYAGVRYRQPDIAKLYEPYVCVMASVYRHNPRDYDEQGRRILCPRFGCITCGEHIAIEPLLYEKFMEGRRIAPRHIMVELDGSETYDVFYAFDTDSVFKAIGDGIANRQIQATPIVRGDKSILERVSSRDIRDREAVEEAYVDGDKDLRNALVDAAGKLEGDAPIDLLRLGIFDLDVARSEQARKGLLKAESTGAVDLINEALRVPMGQEDRDQLVAALERLGKTSPKARTLANVHKGLGRTSGTVDASNWQRALDGVPADPVAADSYAIEARLAQTERDMANKPADAGSRLDLAEGTLQLALEAVETGRGPGNVRAAELHRRLMLEDAQRMAQEAQQLGGKGWRVEATLAATAYELGDKEAAYRHAEAAVRELPENAGDRVSMLAMQIFAEYRQLAIRDCVIEKREWPPEWLADVNTAYSVLAVHPYGTDAHIADHYDFVLALGGRGQASRILDKGLKRFPESHWLHERLRQRILWRRGAEQLLNTYEEMLAENPSPDLEWFAGYAGMVTAEFCRRRGNLDEALQAYDRATQHYLRCIEGNPSSKANVDHYLAMAHAGRARIAYENEDFEKALAEILLSIECKAEAFASQDGLNISPADTARMLLGKFPEIERMDLDAKLREAMSQLDPVLLELPAYEREAPAPDNQPDQRNGRRRGGRRRRDR